MENLITPRLDYIHFIHALCLFFLAGLSLYSLKQQRRMRWLWLGLFAIAQAASIAFQMILKSAPDLELLESISMSFMAMSLFFLALYGLHSLWSGRLRGVGYAVATILVVLPAASAILFGLSGFEATTRLSLGPIAGILAILGTICMGKDSERGQLLRSFYPLMIIYVGLLCVVPAVHLVLRGALAGAATLLQPLPQEAYVVGMAALTLALVSAFARSVAFGSEPPLGSDGESPDASEEEIRRVEIRRRGARIAYAYGLTAVGLAVFLGFSVTEIMGDAAEESMRVELFMRVSAVGNALHPQEVGALRATADDVNLPEYQRLLRQLTKIRIVNPDLRFVYITNLRLSDRKVVFLIDTEPPSSEDYLFPGEEYDEAPQEMKDMFSTGKAKLIGPYRDRWGYWISGLAPIKRDSGEIVGIIGMDIHAKRFIANVAGARLTGIIISFLLAVIGAGVGLIMQRNQMLELTNEALVDEVSQRKRAEQRLREAKRAAEQANQAKSEFLARMSHEIRTPMTVMLGIGDLLMDAELPKEQAELVELFRTTGDGLLRLINDILDLSKVEAGRLELECERFDLQELVEKSVAVMKLMVLEKNVKLLWAIDPGTPLWLKGDAAHLRQVVVNLLGNAVKFTDEGEVELAVRLAAKQPDDDRVCLHFDVRDTGIGVPADKLEHIFERFAQADPSTTRRFGGTGLGLSICKSLVELMGGNISVQSVEGMGTTFTFSIVLEKCSPPADHESKRSWESCESGQDGTPEQNGRILLVEDSDAIQLLINYYLKNTGHVFEVARNGEAGLRKFAEGGFDIVFMDLEMPVMDGFDACKRMRRFERDNGRMPTPIIALTAHAYDEYADRCAEVGFDALVTKPFHREDLLAKVRKALGGAMLDRR